MIRIYFAIPSDRSAKIVSLLLKKLNIRPARSHNLMTKMKCCKPELHRYLQWSHLRATQWLAMLTCSNWEAKRLGHCWCKNVFPLAGLLRKMLTIFQKSLLQISPIISLLGYTLNPINHIFSECRLCRFLQNIIFCHSAAEKYIFRNRTLHPRRQARNIKFYIRTQNVKIQF